MSNEIYRIKYTNLGLQSKYRPYHFNDFNIIYGTWEFTQPGFKENALCDSSSPINYSFHIVKNSICLFINK